MSITINGIRVAEVARLVLTHNGPEDMSDAEIAVASTVGRRVAKMKRMGYMPEHVAPWIDRWIQDEATALREAKQPLNDAGPEA